MRYLQKFIGIQRADQPNKFGKRLLPNPISYSASYKSTTIPKEGSQYTTYQALLSRKQISFFTKH